jgi:serine protease AprX
VSIAIIDTGIDPTHPSFRLPDGSTKVVRSLTTFCAGGGECPEDVSDPVGSNSDVAPPGGHGTHVAGIAVGNDLMLTDRTQVGGAAPGARLVMISASTALVRIEDAFTWVLRHHAAPCGPEVPTSVCPPIKVVSNSWGANSREISRLQEELAAAGVVTVWANGNQGGDGSTDQSNPAGEDPVPGILSAASYDDLGTGTRDGRVAATSSRGQASVPKTWPDISAPGDHIVSACRPYLWICTVVGEQPRNGPGPYDIGTFETMSGTSMAAPQIAGIVALLSQADPTATPAQIEDALKSTAHKYADGAPYSPVGPYTSSYDKGTGLVDAFAAALKVGAARTEAAESPLDVLPGALRSLRSGRGGVVRLAVSLARPATLTVSGAVGGTRVISVVRSLSAGPAALTLEPTAAGRRLLRRHRGVAVQLTLRLVSGGRTTSVARELRLRR